MNKKLLILLFLLQVVGLHAQTQNTNDSLRNVIAQQREDTTEVLTLMRLGQESSSFDSANYYFQKAFVLAQRIGYKRGEAACALKLGGLNDLHGNFGQAIQYVLNALALYEDLKDISAVVSARIMLQGVYRESGDYHNSLIHAFLGLAKAEGDTINSGHRLVTVLYAEIGHTYIQTNQLDSASLYTQKSIDQNELINGVPWNFPIYLLATIQNHQGNYDASIQNYRRAKPLAIQNGFGWDTLQIFNGMSTLFRRIGQLDSAVHYARIVVSSWQHGVELKTFRDGVSNMTMAYRLKNNRDSTLKYLELETALKDSIYSKERDREVQLITFGEKLKQQEIAAARTQYENRLQLYGLGGGILAMILIVALLWRNNMQKQHANAKIEKAYADLKSTQAQLIQSEKMASLGELTAGIAHEIQNPLNFVNNFSEINKELIDELTQALDRGNSMEAKVAAKSIRENEEKITHHGKRADTIVKGMLQHSRISSGAKEPTDISALASEYLRLAFHGLRAKDKSFNALMKTEFDEGIGNVHIVPQDIGRVILNLITNAFYAVAEKKKQSDDTYEPTVWIGTSQVGKKIEITVKDNGNGIPPKVLDKIFQPFFTTKPTGEGTGLGLSISYDIIKAHGGDLKVSTAENHGSEFIITLPL